MRNKNFRAYSLLGNIALVNFNDDMKTKEKKVFAEKILKENKSVITVLEKIGKFKGRLRKIETKLIAGEDSKEVLYRENNCSFRFNVDSTYFSPRLSNERKEISELIKEKDKVFVCFAGVAPFSIVIAKNSKAKVVTNELNREANKYGKLNAIKNKVENHIEFYDGDFKRIAEKLKAEKRKFDVVVMPRPQLKDSFLEDAFKLVKKGTRVYYYDFCSVEDKDKIVEMVNEEAKKAKKKIKILKVKNAGEIAPYKVRLRIDFKVL
jgi:tRNA (guanine37-N1)-methyltransferase